MALPKLTDDLNIIQSLPVYPNRDLGLTAQQLQAKFDEHGNIIQDYLNDVVTPQIDQNTQDIEELQDTKANISDVYTRADLQPYLQGGDTLIREEVFRIVTANNGNGTFTYALDNNATVTAALGTSGEQIFTLNVGTYPLGTNKVEAIINDTLRRSVASGGLKEIDQTHVALTNPESAGAEITVRYFERLGTIENTGLIQIVNGTPTTNLFINKIIIDTSV